MNQSGTPVVRALMGFGLGIGLLGGPLPGCATTQPLNETEITADPIALAARSHVTLTALGVPVAGKSGRGTSLGAVRPVTCVRLPDGNLLTAAHALPTGNAGAVRMVKDPVTGAYRIDAPKTAEDGPAMVIIVDGSAFMTRVIASDPLRYASTASGSRASVPADWAILSLDGARPGAAGSAVRRIGTPVRGERCVMVGFPQALMDDGLFEPSPGVQRLEDLRWLKAPGVVIAGEIDDVERERISIRTEGVLGGRGRGLSGGGVFVERGGVAVLVGIVVQASKQEARLTACPLPEEVLARFRD